MRWDCNKKSCTLSVMSGVRMKLRNVAAEVLTIFILGRSWSGQDNHVDDALVIRWPWGARKEWDQRGSLGPSILSSINQWNHVQPWFLCLEEVDVYTCVGWVGNVTVVDSGTIDQAHSTVSVKLAVLRLRIKLWIKII